MEPPAYSLAERDRRWTLARKLMAAEDVEAGTGAALRLGCQAPAMPVWSGPGLAPGGAPGWSCRPDPPRVLSEGDLLLAGPVSRLGTLETRHPVAIAIGSPHPDIETAAVIARASSDDLRLAPGMPWAFGPGVVVGSGPVTLGGTVIIAEDGPIELNPGTARLLRAGGPPGDGDGCDDNP